MKISIKEIQYLHIVMQMESSPEALDVIEHKAVYEHYPPMSEQN